MSGSVYLAGPIQHKPDNGRAWRERIGSALEDCGVDVLNPLDEVAVDCATQAVVRRDKNLLDTADAVFVCWERLPMAGTPMEMYRCYERDIPVIVWADCPMDEVSGWVFEHSVVTPNRDVAVTVAAQVVQ